jgi:RecA DNA recombination protein
MLPQALLDLLPSSLPVPLSSPTGIASRTLPTGVEALDAGLVGGGLPRGRLTEVIGVRGSGKATLLRRIVEQTLSHAGWVAYIDATRTLAPRDWAHLGEGEGLWMIRPRDPARAAWCADVLLRCGAFALVVIDSAPVLSRGVAVRLTRLARETGAALIIAGEEGSGSLVGGAVRLHVQRASAPSHPPSPRERRMTILVEKGGGGGTHRTVEVSCAIGVARRLCTHPEVPDRRGVARRPAGRPGGERRAAPAAVPRSGGDTPNEVGNSRVLARKRRCAEPEFATGDLHTDAHIGRMERSAGTGTLG